MKELWNLTVRTGEWLVDPANRVVALIIGGGVLALLVVIWLL